MNPGPQHPDQLQPTNPYAAPLHGQPTVPRPSFQYQGGVWRRGDFLVMHRRAQLPPVCIKTGGLATVCLRCGLSWHHPAMYFVLLLGVWPYFVISLFASKNANIEVGLCDAVAARRRQRSLVGILICGAGLLVFGAAIALKFALQSDLPLFGIPVAIIMLIGGFCWSYYGGRVVSAHKIGSEYIWLRGVSPHVLDRFPEWPQP